MDGSSILQIIGQIKAEHGEQLGARIDKGAGLWYAGQVTYCGSNLWLVDNGKGERYEVRFALNWSCNCKDHAHGAPALDNFFGGSGPANRICKHVISAILSWQIDSPEATTRPAPAPVLTLPGWLVQPESVKPAVVSHDSADMGIDARDAAPPAWFGDNLDIEEWLG